MACARFGPTPFSSVSSAAVAVLIFSALAGAEKVSASGGRLDAFFLDEGFGSLDPEHLDLALQGIERLVTESSNRLVTVVSHVPEMRERLEDLIVLDKDPLTGQSVVRQGARRKA